MFALSKQVYSFTLWGIKIILIYICIIFIIIIVAIIIAIIIIIDQKWFLET